jgi:NAD+ synthase
MLLRLHDPQAKVDEIVHFIKQTFAENHKPHAVIAVSGGIDSALALTLLTRALGASHITPLLLPYAEQPVADAQLIARHNSIPEAQWRTVNIQPLVDTACEQLSLSPQTQDAADKIRVGNIMARSRMIVVFDTAKKLNALVCGTENKSEHFLGYFTRFGDAASDLEPLSQLYKTQVRQLAEYLELPAVFTTKAPSAGLWEDQTDELEMGFSYEQADQVLHYLIDQAYQPADITIPEIDSEVVRSVIAQVEAMRFKLHVPYEL